jgi:uncharacterized MAPEG superfamily protein
MPYAWTIAAKASKPKFDNSQPRVFLSGLQGWGERANWVQINSFEAFPVFAAAVIIASQIGKIDPATLNMLALLFVVCRIAYGICYVTDKATLRSLVWFIGTGLWVSMFILSA